jgi:CRP-like cAMP-binding protein
MNEDRLELLRLSPLVVELNDEQRVILSRLITARTLRDAEVLIREGEVSNELHLLIAGSLAMTRDTENGEWIVLHVLRPGDLAGELGFLDDLQQSATVRAFGECKVISLRRDRLEELIYTDPMIVYLVMRALSREVHGILRRMSIQHIELTNYITRPHGRY